jgi:hypothetical protein
MSDLTENEVIDRLKTSLGEAGAAAVALSIETRMGPNYVRLRENLLLVEGCCRQLSAMREDTRWLPLGRMAAEAQQRARNWLAGVKVNRDDGGTVRLATAMATRHPLFDRLAQNLAFWLAGINRMLEMRTGKLGPTLPDMPRRERPVGAPVPVSLPPGMTKTSGGIIVPISGTVH